jgi:hypothetical protein
MAGEPSPFDIDSGFNIMIKHTKDSPWYAAQRAGSPISLDEILPAGWEKKYIEDMARIVNVTILEYEEQKKAVQRTYANELDWELLQSEFNL